jgi:hypothetical protein
MQKAPFQMRREPTLRRNSVLQLNWVFDEFFVNPDVWKSLFKPLGVGCRPVQDMKGNELKTVVQLVASEDEVEAILDGYPGEVCPNCGRMKYFYIERGPFPKLRTLPRGHLVKTKEYFGSGGRAYKAVIVSQSLVRALVAQRIRGVSFKPVAEDGA